LGETVLCSISASRFVYTVLTHRSQLSYSPLYGLRNSNSHGNT